MKLYAAALLAMRRELSLQDKERFDRIEDNLLRPKEKRAGKHCTGVHIKVERFKARGPYERPMIQSAIERLVVEWSDNTSTEYRMSVLRNRGSNDVAAVRNNRANRTYRSFTGDTVYPSLP